MASRVLEDPVLRVGKLDAKRDFLDVRDLVSAYVTAMAAAKLTVEGSLMITASGEAHRIGDVLESLRKKCEGRRQGGGRTSRASHSKWG